MKKKIITILVTITFITGAGTAAGVIIDKQIKTEEASVSEEMTSSTLPKTSAKAESTETVTDKKVAAKKAPTEAQTTENQPEDTTTTTTEVATVIKTTAKRPIFYYPVFYKVALIDEEVYNIYRLSGDGPDNGKYAYYEDNDTEKEKHILDNIDNLNFICDFRTDKKCFDKNNEPYWQIIDAVYDNGQDFVCFDKNGNSFYFDKEENRIYID